MDAFADSLGITGEAAANIVLTAVALVAVLVGRAVVLRLVQSTSASPPEQYRARKLVNYAATGIFLLTVALIWVKAFADLPTYLGLVSAGIAIALADVLRNMAGWAFILTRRPFAVGDRVEVNQLRGDVVDIRLFRFSLMEVGNWVDAEQSTGRLVHVPNGVVFSQAVANYTEGFPYIWDEMKVLITFESEWRLAETMLKTILEEHTPDLGGAAERRIRETARTYQIKVGALTPIVYVSVQDSGILLTARYLVEARSRRGIADRLWRAILDGIEERPTVELAYPTVRTYLSGPVRVDNG